MLAPPSCFRIITDAIAARKSAYLLLGQPLNQINLVTPALLGI